MKKDPDAEVLKYYKQYPARRMLYLAGLAALYFQDTYRFNDFNLATVIQVPLEHLRTTTTHHTTHNNHPHDQPAASRGIPIPRSCLAVGLLAPSPLVEAHALWPSSPFLLSSWTVAQARWWTRCWIGYQSPCG